jgi:hypothetical protein
MTGYPAPPAHVQPFVDALGPELAIDLLLAFGGAELHIAVLPRANSRLVEVVGQDGAEKLAALADGLGTRWQRRVPTAKPWIAKVWFSQGLSKSEIARRLHTTDVTVRAWLKAQQDERPQAASKVDPRQPPLL